MLTLGDFKVGVSVGIYCTKCTLNTGVNTNFEITHCTSSCTVLFLRGCCDRKNKTLKYENI
jgi:hypothetical protein